ncbi:hypothetical protein [Oceanobacillus limi]|nr:hypothetical protein [Oceanobacillus limi]
MVRNELSKVPSEVSYENKLRRIESYLVDIIIDLKKQQDTLDRIEQVISNIIRGKKKLSISKIAEKSRIRKTIYNHP